MKLNQILSTGEEKKKRQKTKKVKEPKAPINIKGIVAVFACLILVFGLVIVVINIYGIFERRQNDVVYTEPVVSITQMDNRVRITARYDGGIDRIAYYWTEEYREEEVLRDGITEFQELIDIPRGQGILTVELIDIEGNTTVFRESFIAIAVNAIEGEPEAEIVVEKEGGLRYIAYRVNEGEEIRVEASPEDPTRIEVRLNMHYLELVRGDNTITVRAVDVNNNERIVVQAAPMVNIPEVTIGSISNYRYVDFLVTHDVGFERIEFTLNGETFIYDESFAGFDPELTVFEGTIVLREGQNVLTIVAYSREGTRVARRGEATVYLR